MFTKAKTLIADYLIANTMIDCLQKDPFVMSYLDGEKEKIMTAEMYGAPWKIMMNVYSSVSRRIVDLITTRSIMEKVWDEATRKYVSFVELYKEPLKVAIYSEVERLAMGRAAEDWSEFMLVAVSKEKYPDKTVLNMTNPTRIAAELATVEANMPRIIALKAGLEEPIRCEKCNIAEACMWEGDHQSFVDALIQAGFVDKTESGLLIHDWFDYAGRLIIQKDIKKEKNKERGNALEKNQQKHVTLM